MKPKPTDGPAIPNTTVEDLRQQIAAGRQADDIFRLVVEARPNAIVRANAQGGARLVNAVAESFFGCARPSADFRRRAAKPTPPPART